MLRLIRCRTCSHIQHSWQDRFCVACWSSDLEVKPTEGQGTLLSWATFHANYGLEGFTPPYSIGLVLLEDGLEIQCYLQGDVREARYGDRLVVVERDRDIGELAGAEEGGLRGVFVAPM